MTEPAPEIVEPKSLPQGLTGDDPAPLQLPGSGLVIWGLIGLVIVAGVLVMAVSWRQFRLPDGPSISFNVPDLSFPEPGSSPDRPPPIRTDPRPEAQPSASADARPVGQIDKPGGASRPAPGETAGQLSGGAGKPL